MSSHPSFPVAVLVRTLLLAVLAAAAMPVGMTARAQTGDFAAALRAAPPGAVIELPGGDWGELKLGGADGPSVIRSADPANPARFSGMNVNGAHGLALEGLVLDYEWSENDRLEEGPFGIWDSENVRLTGLRILGDTAGGADPTSRGFASGIGLIIRTSRDVVLEDSEVTTFYRGIIVRDSDRVTLRGNDIHSLRSDGINVVGTQGIRIIANHIHDFIRSIESKDHADMIQFWTTHAPRPTTDVVIRDNLLNSGAGYYTQSIFMRNDRVDQGEAGSEMYYQNVVIEENVIVNAHAHGISTGETAGLTIRGNTLVHNPAGVGPDRSPTHIVWVPRINVNDKSVDVIVENNITSRVPDQRPGWRVQGNLIVQPHSRIETGHYTRIFVGIPGGDPADPASYAPRPGGPADRPGLGAARTRNR